MRSFALLFVAAATLVAVQPAAAQVSFGPQAAWGDGTDFGVGARAEFGIADLFGASEAPFSNLFAATTATFFFPDCGGGFFGAGSGVDCSFFEVAATAAVPFEIEANATPYAGAGVHLGRFGVSAGGVSSSETKFGLGLVGGVKFPFAGSNGFVEGKFNLGTYDQFVIQFGVLFGN